MSAARDERGHDDTERLAALLEEWGIAEALPPAPVLSARVREAVQRWEADIGREAAHDRAALAGQIVRRLSGTGAAPEVVLDAALRLAEEAPQEG